MTNKKSKKLSNQNVVDIYKALADKTRLGIALNLSTSKKELACSELAARFDLSQPAFSHHCQKLIKVGILNMRKDGTIHYLSLNEESLNLAGIDLKNLW